MAYFKTGKRLGLVEEKRSEMLWIKIKLGQRLVKRSSTTLNDFIRALSLSSKGSYEVSIC